MANIVGGEWRQLAWQVYRGRWFMVFSSFLIMAASGGTYIFGIYSTDIKASLGYDQTTLNLLSFFKDLGSNVGLLSGLINEVTPPWVVLSMGAAMNITGYLMIWLGVTGKIAKPPVWQMCLYICLGANSQAFANTGALVTCVKNFPQSRGIVLGLLKGFVGLSGAIITQIYHTIYGDDSKGLILLIAFLPAVISTFSVHTIRIITLTRQTKDEVKAFYNFLYISLGLAGFLMVVIIVENSVGFSQSGYAGSLTVVLTLLFSPLAVVVREEIQTWNAEKQTSNGSELKNMKAFESKSLPTPTKVSEKEASCWSTMFKPPSRGDDYTILQALVSIDMIILFLATICGVGGTLTAIDNLGQIGHSLDYSKRSISTFVSLVSIWNYLGRVFSGFTSEVLLTRYKFPRPLMLTFTLLFSCIGHLLIAFALPGSIYVASVIIGFCFGAQWPLLFAIISEIFGLKYYSTLYNFGSMASPIGSYLLNVRVAGHLYDREAAKQMLELGLTRKPGEDLTCNGVHCFRLAFIIITAVTLLGTLISLILVWRTREFYRGDIYKKYKEDSTTAEIGMGMAQYSQDGSVVKDGETVI